MTFQARLKAARGATGLTQAQFAAQTGVSTRSYQGYEDGRSLPCAEAIGGFVRLGINANWLLTGEGEMLLGESPVDRATMADPEQATMEVPQPLNVGALRAILRAAIEMVQAGATTPDRAADLAAKLYATALESGEITPTGVGTGNQGKAA